MIKCTELHISLIWTKYPFTHLLCTCAVHVCGPHVFEKKRER